MKTTSRPGEAPFGSNIVDDVLAEKIGCLVAEAMNEFAGALTVSFSSNAKEWFLVNPSRKQAREFWDGRMAIAVSALHAWAGVKPRNLASASSS